MFLLLATSRYTYSRLKALSQLLPNGSPRHMSIIERLVVGTLLPMKFMLANLLIIGLVNRPGNLSFVHCNNSIGCMEKAALQSNISELAHPSSRDRWMVSRNALPNRLTQAHILQIVR
jgi:hypothetical protein